MPHVNNTKEHKLFDYFLASAERRLNEPETVDVVKKYAEMLWHQKTELPSYEFLKSMEKTASKKQFFRTLCVLELLSQFPACEENKAKQLQVTTTRLHDELLGNNCPQHTGRYSPSQRWTLPESTTYLRKELLPLQTRHYSHKTAS